MSPEWVEALGTWFSGILIAGSLIFVWVQTRHSKEQTLGAQLANYHNLYLMWFTVDRVFIEHPEMRPYFYDRAEISAAPADIRLRLDAVSHMIFDCFDDVYHHLEHLPQSTSQAWSVFMKDLYKHTPYLKDFLQKNEQWYSPDFVRYLKG
jgi:hypothetical protein